MADIDETQTPEAEQDEEQDEEESGFIAPGFAPDDDTDPEAAQEQAGPQGMTEQEGEAASKAVDKASKVYVKKVQEAYGDHFNQFAGCPLCASDFPGFIHLAKVGGFSREFVSQVNEILTGFRQVEYKQLPGFQECPTCAGEGKGFTGSRVPDKQYETCPSCRGRGYLAPMVEKSNGHAPEAAHQYAAPDAPVFTSGEDVDAWGEPRTLPDGRDNPNFGRMPQFKTLVDPYGITANLTVREAV